MTPPNNKRFLFIHIMKTGGTSFADILKINFPDKIRYPNACFDTDTDYARRIQSYTDVPAFVQDVNSLGSKLRVASAHVPYAVRSLLHDHYETITILRHPVDRTLSYLKHCRQYHKEHENFALEEIYERAWFKHTFIQNYQTKIFSMSAAEAMEKIRFADNAPPIPSLQDLTTRENLSAEVIEFEKLNPARFTLESFVPSTGVITVDRNRLDTAKRNLTKVELVGVTETYDQFLCQLRDRYSWEIQSMPKRNVGVTQKVSDEFESRIAEDNWADIELYDFARSLAAGY